MANRFPCCYSLISQCVQHKYLNNDCYFCAFVVHSLSPCTFITLPSSIDIVLWFIQAITLIIKSFFLQNVLSRRFLLKSFVFFSSSDYLGFSSSGCEIYIKIKQITREKKMYTYLKTFSCLSQSLVVDLTVDFE